MKRLVLLTFLLAACADTTPTAVDEAVSREAGAVTDASFRDDNVARDDNGIVLPRAATASTRAHNAAQILPEEFDKEMGFATFGFIATLEDPVLPKFKGSGSSMNLSTNDFITGHAPDTVNPLLWSHSQIMAANEGLFQLSRNIWQVRGFDVSNITFIRGREGYIVVDPLNAAEASRAAYDLMRTHVENAPITGIVYTHSHSDHFAGIDGVYTEGDDIPIIAPRNFLAEVAGEWLIAGNAMGRRAFYQFALFLEENERGRIGAGQGPRISLGQHNLVPATEEVDEDFAKISVDGIELQILNTPGAEAPSSFVFYVPSEKALFMSETVNAGIHNVQTLRGALVRDAKAWADALSESLQLFPEAQIMVPSHHWPRYGQDEVREFIASQRDVYKYMHDQTVRLMNQGLTPTEIAENLKLPDTLGGKWFNRGFYGTLSHNSKAVYGRYMGWYDGDPANLDPHIPTERAVRYVDAIGGANRVLEIGGEAFDKGDYRWSAELIKHLVFAQPDNQAARELLADSYEQMGYQAESAIWRNIYLSGAKELRQNGPDLYEDEPDEYLLSAASDAQVLDLMAVRLNPALAGDQRLSVNIHFKATDGRFNVSLRNGVLVHSPELDPSTGTLSGDRRGLMAVGLGFLPLGQAKLLRLVQEEGDASAFEQMGDMMDKPSLDFNIIEP